MGNLFKSLPIIFASIWAKKDLVKNVANVVIRVIDSLDGQIDWVQQDDKQKK